MLASTNQETLSLISTPASLRCEMMPRKGIPRRDHNIQRLTHCSEEILQEPSRTARDLQLNVMEIKMVHCTLYCNLILARGRSHNTLGVTILTGCSSGTLPKILPMGTASLPSNLFISGGILFQSPSTTCSRYSGSILSSPTPQGAIMVIIIIIYIITISILAQCC